MGVKRPATTGAKERAARRVPAATKSSRQTAEDERKVRQGRMFGWRMVLEGLPYGFGHLREDSAHCVCTNHLELIWDLAQVTPALPDMAP